MAECPDRLEVTRFRASLLGVRIAVIIGLDIEVRAAEVKVLAAVDVGFERRVIATPTRVFFSALPCAARLGARNGSRSEISAMIMSVNSLAIMTP
jgi:hypothetical protein